MGRDIISPILKLHELRKKGVTLHMLLEAERDAIPDVPAIYFVEPTPNNIQQIITDCTKQLYSTVHLNFLYPLSREMLELLARLSVEASCTSMVCSIPIDKNLVTYVCFRLLKYMINTQTLFRWNRVSFHYIYQIVIVHIMMQQ